MDLGHLWLRQWKLRKTLLENLPPAPFLTSFSLLTHPHAARPPACSAVQRSAVQCGSSESFHPLAGTLPSGCVYAKGGTHTVNKISLPQSVQHAYAT